MAFSTIFLPNEKKSTKLPSKRKNPKIVPQIASFQSQDPKPEKASLELSDGGLLQAASETLISGRLQHA
jgi:hypothetical protein